MKTTVKRTRHWIDPPLQLQLLARLGFYLVAYSLALIHVAFLYDVISNLPAALNQGVVVYYSEFFARQLPLLAALILVLPIFLYDMIKFSHRFAGPLYRFRKTLEAMAADRPVASVKIRKHDFLRNWVVPLNTVIQKWNNFQDPPIADVVEENTAVDECREENEAAPAAAS